MKIQQGPCKKFIVQKHETNISDYFGGKYAKSFQNLKLFFKKKAFFRNVKINDASIRGSH